MDIVAKVPSSWEETSEGPAALLRAARDADDAVLNEMAVQVRKFGFGSMDVNMADSSGRVSLRRTGRIIVIFERSIDKTWFIKITSDFGETDGDIFYLYQFFGLDSKRKFILRIMKSNNMR